MIDGRAAEERQKIRLRFARNRRGDLANLTRVDAHIRDPKSRLAATAAVRSAMLVYYQRASLHAGEPAVRSSELRSIGRVMIPAAEFRDERRQSILIASTAGLVPAVRYRFFRPD